MWRALVVVAALGGLTAPVRADHNLKPTSRPIAATVHLSSSTKNLSAGLSACYGGYFHTNAATDFLVSGILNGFDHDDLDSIRLTLAQTVGARLSLAPFRLERRCRPAPWTYRKWPELVPGVGVWTVGEFDSLSQTFRTGDSGAFLGWSLGVFTNFVFSDVTVSFVFRPFEQTAYYQGDVWDATTFRFNNPTLEVELTYVLPW